MVLLIAALALSACAPTGPAIDTCDWGRYHADCGGNGPPVVGCERGSGECRWFLGGVVADGYVESPCPADEVCCLAALDGAATWAFADWSPSGDVLQQAREDLGLFTERGMVGLGPFDADEPHGVPVTFDYVPPAEPRMECNGEPGVAGCPFIDPPDVRFERRGASWIIRSVRRSPATSTKVALEVLPDGTGSYHARMIFVNTGDHSAPTVRCYPPRGGWVPMTGTLRLTPDALEHPSESHGELDVTFPSSGGTLVARF